MANLRTKRASTTAPKHVEVVTVSPAKKKVTAKQKMVVVAKRGSLTGEGEVKKPARAPTTAKMVIDAVTNLQERNGSSLESIKKYMSEHFNVDPEKPKTAGLITKALTSSLEKGTLLQTKGTRASVAFKLPNKETKPKTEKKSTAVKKPVAVRLTTRKRKSGSPTKGPEATTAVKKPVAVRLTTRKRKSGSPTKGPEAKKRKSASPRKATGAKKRNSISLAKPVTSVLASPQKVVPKLRNSTRVSKKADENTAVVEPNPKTADENLFLEPKPKKADETPVLEPKPKKPVAIQKQREAKPAATPTPKTPKASPSTKSKFKASENDNEIDKLNNYREQIQIEDGATGYSYEKIFSKFLDNKVQHIEVEDPYIRSPHQCDNFLRFVELCIRQCPNLRGVRLHTRPDNKDKDQEQAKRLGTISKSVQNLPGRTVKIEIQYSNVLHDREIRLDNGWVIKIGRGLDYFKPMDRFCLGWNDFYFRPCKATRVDIFHSKDLHRF